MSKVVDVKTPIPDGTGNFTGFFAHNISGTNVVFHGLGSGGQDGIYLYDGTTLTKVVDLNTSIPSGSGHFTGVDGPVIDGANIAFSGVGDGGQNGIYLFNGTTLSKVVDLNTLIPSGSGHFTGVGSAGISGDNIVFMGFGVDQNRWPGLFGQAEANYKWYAACSCCYLLLW